MDPCTQPDCVIEGTVSEDFFMVRVLSPSLLGGFSTTNFTRAEEPRLSWTQLPH
jgi:hypothetical protein